MHGSRAPAADHGRPRGVRRPRRRARSGTAPAGATTTLTATPEPGSVFAGWTGAGCAGTGPCTIVLAPGENDVTATFLPAVTLSVLRAGAGTGRVVSSPEGIDCGATCAAHRGRRARVGVTTIRGHRSSRSCEQGVRPS